MIEAILDLNDAIVVAVAVLVGVFALVRSRSDVWRSNYEAERVRCEQLSKEYQAAQTELAHLRTLPSLEKLYELLVSHDAREKDIWERIGLILNQIVERLGEKEARL